MRKITLKFAVLMLWVCLVTPPAFALNLIDNGDFATGTFSGWDVGIIPDYGDGGRPYSVDSGGDGWAIYADDSLVADLPGLSAYNGFDGGVVDEFGQPVYEADLNFYLTQGFSTTGYIDSAFLQFTFDIYGGPSPSYSSRGTPVEDRVFDVSLLNSSGDLIETFYSYSNTALDGYGDLNPVATISIDISNALNLIGADDYFLSFNELIPQYYTGGGAICHR